MHSPSLRFSVLLLLLAATTVHGQVSSTATPSSPAPPRPTGGHAHTDTVTLDQYVITAAPFQRNQVDLAQATTVLTDRALLLKQKPTLGETLAGETGMSATHFGPGASRPIIRGLGGDRIRLLENGVGTIDASVTSPDHAVSVEPFLVERIEIVRGPASLLYGSSALGGVVNVITHRVETEVPAERSRGMAAVRYGSAAGEFARGALFDYALVRAPDRALVLHLDGFRRSADDLRIPGYAESERIREEEIEEALEHGEPVPSFARGRLPNSSLDTEGGSAGLSFVNKSFHVGANYNGLNSNYGVPGHAHGHDDEDEGTRIDLRQRRVDLQAEWRNEAGPVSGVRFKFGHARYRHSEIEPDGDAGTVFTNKGHDARLEVLHGAGPAWIGAVGLQFTRSDFDASGEEAFLPGSITSNAAVFAFEEVVRGPVTWQFGARYDRTRVDPEGDRARTDGELSGSVGAVYKLDEAHVLALSIAHTGRAPNAQERFAGGPHAGTSSFEIGDPRLRSEKSLGLDAGLRRRTGFVTGAFNLFANRFDGYIFEQPTGLYAVEHEGEWEQLPAGHPEVAEHGGLPVFRYVQRDARFWGAEVETLWHLHESTGRQLDLRLAADMTRGREGGRNLPRIPASRVTAGVVWIGGPWNAGVESQFVFEQKRTAPHETPSDAYTLLAAHVGYALTARNVNYQLFVRGTNLANEEIRPHTSFVKELAPLARRAVSLGVRVMF
jgi:iron complex outermembrane recepter protein